jgi:hypothetical protein
MLEVDRLLVACPRCLAWPMSANVAAPNWTGPGGIRFRCASCGHQETVPLPSSQPVEA